MKKDLIKAYDSYSELETPLYFTTCFNTLPSDLAVEVPLKSTKENIEKALRIINIKEIGLEVVTKSWNVKNNKHVEEAEDFVDEYLFKAKDRKATLAVKLLNNNLDVEFLYDAADEALEQWVLNASHKIRAEFGEAKAPSFKVLSKSRSGFYTKNVKTEPFDLDIAKFYNEDFIPINQTIRAAINENKAGLILLHGLPGTGKTSYIKDLINSFEEKIFIFIQNEFVNELLHPDFISFLLKHRNCILIIEDAEKVLTTREQSSENSVVSTILQLTDGLFSDYLNTKIICTFNTSIDKIDKALFRKGRMIAYYDFKALEIAKANALLSTIGNETTDKPLTLAEIFNMKSQAFVQEEKKKIGFLK